MFSVYGHKPSSYYKFKAYIVAGFAHLQEHVRHQAYVPRAKAAWARMALVFTAHPAQTQESYGQHLWFTVKMSLELMLLGLLLFTHGVFPFLFMRTVSRRIDKIYLIMRSRIPKSRRDALEGEYDI